MLEIKWLIVWRPKWDLVTAENALITLTQMDFHCPEWVRMRLQLKTQYTRVEVTKLHIFCSDAICGKVICYGDGLSTFVQAGYARQTSLFTINNILCR